MIGVARMKTLGMMMAAGLAVLAGSPLVLAQGLPPTAVADLQQRYNESLGSSPELISGPEYADKTLRYHRREGFPYFLQPDPQPGSVYYNNHPFSQQQLAYDVLLDQVVLQFPGSPYRLRLLNERVRSFTIGPHQFVRLVADSASGNVLRTGFYEVLTEGPVQVLARRAKRLQEKREQDFINAELIVTDKLFVKKADRFYPITNKSSLLRLLADRGKDVQKYGQAHKLKFNKKHLEASAVELARYYNDLPTQ
jgi:hypothetical protein